jgi:hypothetical protein
MFETPEIPKPTGGIMKLEKGENKFRILDTPFAAYEYWEDEGNKRKPVRVLTYEEVPAEKKIGDDQAKYFWAIPVYDYATASIRVLQVPQVTVLRSIQQFIDDSEWGDPKGYDIVVNRSGDGMKTEYAVMPKPKTVLDKDAIDQWKEVKPTLDLSRMMTNENPFGEKVGNSEDVKAEVSDEDIEEIPF